MSQASAELAELLTELRATEGKIARGKLLMRGGKLFKGMSTDERIRVAYTLGVDNVGELLLKMDQDQLTDEDLAALVERAELLDPVEVGALIRDLDDPEARKQAVHGLVDEFVREPEGEGDAADTAHDGDEDLGAYEELDEVDEGEALPHRPVERPSPDVGASSPLDDAGPQPDPTTPPAPTAPPAPTPLPAPTPPSAAPAPAELTASALAAAVGAVASSVAQLRTLRTRTDEAAMLDVAQLRQLVRTFPEGWRRRRAVSTLFADGVPASFDAALEVLGELPAEADWVWAASTLVRERELASDSLNRLLQAAPSERARQRIAMRAS
ncbi:MAG: hypothetical protein KY469_14215 [Actinobacteria bacterium]|nr:hypothetical protein [Actinomycetota bacterium]